MVPTRSWQWMKKGNILNENSVKLVLCNVLKADTAEKTCSYWISSIIKSLKNNKGRNELFTNVIKKIRNRCLICGEWCGEIGFWLKAFGLFALFILPFLLFQCHNLNILNHLSFKVKNCNIWIFEVEAKLWLLSAVRLEGFS